LTQQSDFVTDFMSLTEGSVSPEIFKLWSGISALAGALERRVWARSGMGVIYPNLYVLLVAPPGVGKFIIETVRELWQDTVEPGSKLPAFNVASDSVTNASLMDELNKAKDVFLTPSGPPLVYHSLLVAAEEFQVLLPAYDQQFIASLNSIYNNKSLHRESRRTGSVKELSIENPHLCIFGGAQPAYFVSTFPDEAWSTGFARRVIMIYSSESPLRDFFYESPVPVGLREKILRRLAAVSQLYGPMLWQREAAQKLTHWHQAGGPPRPSHSKLVHYNRSRSVFVAKLATISAISRTMEMRIELIDVERALEWLLQAEKLMPDIFREMIGKSDRQIIEELHFFVTQLWVKGKRNGGITSESIYDFLSHRCPSDKTEKLFQLAERSGIIARVGGTQDMYVPKPIRDFSEE
jgi:hypothetical protein